MEKLEHKVGGTLCGQTLLLAKGPEVLGVINDKRFREKLKVAERNDALPVDKSENK